MKEHLAVFDRARGFVIAWQLDGDMGMAIGEDWSTSDVIAEKMETAKSTGDDDGVLTYLAHVHLERLASEGQDEPYLDRNAGCYAFQSRRCALRALSEINAEFREWKSGKVWPEWAKTALAAGWKAPKGWAP